MSTNPSDQHDGQENRDSVKPRAVDGRAFLDQRLAVTGRVADLVNRWRDTARRGESVVHDLGDPLRIAPIIRPGASSMRRVVHSQNLRHAFK